MHSFARSGRPHGCVTALLFVSAVVVTLPGALLAKADTLCTPLTSPDLISGDVQGVYWFGSVGDISAYGLGATVCNLGTCRANWVANTPEHPVIGQNLFRLKDGRFEQLGQSWLKHGYSASQMNSCSSSCDPSDEDHLGVNCSDTYVGVLNGNQAGQGPKFEVNPTTGVFPFPATNISTTGDAIYKRLQVHNSDLDPSLNLGALYFAEVQYVSHDDASRGHGANNASYRRVGVLRTNDGQYQLIVGATTVREKAAIQAWKAADPTVVEVVKTSAEGTLILSASAKSLGGGMYRYEYALQNIDCDRAAGAFHVPLVSGSVVSNLGFHDVDYHSGEPFDGSDWTGVAGPSEVSWSTVPYAVDPNANALRWGTLYNFRFDANIHPGAVTATIGFFKPGQTSSFTIQTIGPALCVVNGVCEAGETCANCAADCLHQGGGPGCCGNGVCDGGEDVCRCAADCGAPPPNETSCGDTIDNDCDGSMDCADRDCCTSTACAAYDTDGDHVAALCDCNDANPQLYAAPGEVRDLHLSRDESGYVHLEWSPPLDPGGSTAVTYDALRSSVANDFVGAAGCIAAGGTDTSAIDSPESPAPAVRYYLTRAVNDCPAGRGPLGFSSSGLPQQGRSCP